MTSRCTLGPFRTTYAGSSALVAHSRKSFRRQRGAHGNQRIATPHDSVDPPSGTGGAAFANARRPWRHRPHCETTDGRVPGLTPSCTYRRKRAAAPSSAQSHGDGGPPRASKFAGPGGDHPFGCRSDVGQTEIRGRAEPPNRVLSRPELRTLGERMRASGR
jgi:hypothetical protein